MAVQSSSNIANNNNKKTVCRKSVLSYILAMQPCTEHTLTGAPVMLLIVTYDRRLYKVCNFKSAAIKLKNVFLMQRSSDWRLLLEPICLYYSSTTVENNGVPLLYFRQFDPVFDLLFNFRTFLKSRTSFIRCSTVFW